MKYLEKYCIRPIGISIALLLAAACSAGGVGWDEIADIEAAKRYPATMSSRIRVTEEEVPLQAFTQEFDDVFMDFPFRGESVGPSVSDRKQSQILGTPYSVKYENSVLTVFRDGHVIAERSLPNIFYMHPVSSGAVLKDSLRQDRIICRTTSRATTGLHYILVLDGTGEILYERVLPAAADWDVLPGASGEVIIGGARSKTTIE